MFLLSTFYLLGTHSHHVRIMMVNNNIWGNSVHAADSVTCSSTIVLPFFQFLWITYCKSLCHLGRKYNRHGEIEVFIFIFFNLVPLEEKMALYFVTQILGKQHMASLTEPQNQNWQILEEKKLTIAKSGIAVHAAWTALYPPAAAQKLPRFSWQ